MQVGLVFLALRRRHLALAEHLPDDLPVEAGAGQLGEEILLVLLEKADLLALALDPLDVAGQRGRPVVPHGHVLLCPVPLSVMCDVTGNV